MADTLARMRQLIGTTAQWSANDIVLGNGEIGIETIDATTRRMKLGDGTRTWSALPYSSVTQAELAAEITNRTNADTALDARLDTLEAGDRFVSELSGNDSNAGTFASPYQTWDKAYAATPAGATIWLLGTPDAPQTYKSTAGAATVLAKQIAVRAINRHGAILTSSGTTNTAISINPAAGQTITLDGVIIDPSPDASSTMLYCIQLNSQAVPYYLNCIDCLFRGWVQRAVYTVSASFKGHLRFTGCSFLGNDCESGIRLETLAGGGIEARDCTFSLVDQNAVSNGPIRIIGTAAGVYARIIDCRARVTLKASLAGPGTHNCFYIQGIAGALISGGSIDVLGPGSPRAVYGAVIQTNGAGDATELPVDDSVIEDIGIYCEPSGGGIACGIGNDGAGDSTKTNRCIMRRVKVGCSRAAGESGGLHGVFFGRVTNGAMHDNLTIGIGYNGFKNTVGCNATGNTLVGSIGTAFNLKGAVGGFVRDNACSARPDTSMIMFALEQDPASGIFTSGVTIAQNYCVNEGSSSVVFVDINVGSTFAAFTNNAWANLVGTLHPNPFQNGATNYSTFAAWKAAIGTTDVANFA